MKRILSTALALVMIFTFASFPTFAATTGTVTVYPEYPDVLPRNYDYIVKVTGANGTFEIPVYNSSRKDNSYHSAKFTESTRRFCEFAFTGEVTVEVETRLEMNKVAIVPTDEGVTPTVSGNKIKFTLNKAANLALRLNDDDQTILSIFAEDKAVNDEMEAEVEALIAAGEPVLYYEAGLNKISTDKKKCTAVEGTHYGAVAATGQQTLSQGVTVYIAPGAVVESRFNVRKDDVTVLGRGAILDPRTDRNSDGVRMFDLLNQTGHNDVVDNTTIKGVKFLDANSFVINIYGVNNTLIQDVKMLASEISTDGIGIHVGENIKIQDVYMYVNDDALVFSEVTNNIVVDNVTIGTGHAALHPHAQNLAFTASNISIFRCGDFFRSNEAESSSAWDITLTNIYAADVVPGTHNDFIRVAWQNAGAKNVTMTNASFPSTLNTIYNDSTSTGTKFICDNVYFGSTRFTSASQVTKSDLAYNKYDGTQVTFEFGSTADPTAAGVGTNSVFASSSAATKVYLGDYPLAYDKTVTQSVSGTTYYPVNALLKELGYTVDVNSNTAKVTSANGTVKFTSNGVNAYGLDVNVTEYKISDGTLLLSGNALNTIFGLTVSGNTVSAPQSGNLIKDGGFENIRSSRMPSTSENAYTFDWNTFYFGGALISTDAHSGETAMRVYNKEGVLNTTKGLAQYIGPELMANGNGTYLFEAWVKLGPTASAETLDFGLVQTGWKVKDGNNLIGINKLKSVTLTSNWQKVTYEITINDVTADGYDRAFFYAGTYADTDSVDFLIDDAALYKVSSVSNTTQLSTLLNGDIPMAEEGYMFKGWYDTNGNLYKTNSAVSGTVNLHPEFVKIGETMYSEVAKAEHDFNPVDEGAKYINGMYLQGTQVRVSGGTANTTGLRFITANNINMTTAMTNAGFTNIQYGTRVIASTKFGNNAVLTQSTSGGVNSYAVNIWHTAEAMGADYQKYTACVRNIKKDNMKTDIIARPYVEYTDLSGVKRILYGEQYGTNIYDVALEAYESPDETTITKKYIYDEILTYFDIKGDNDIRPEW